jgi:hypothetical protein
MQALTQGERTWIINTQTADKPDNQKNFEMEEISSSKVWNTHRVSEEGESQYSRCFQVYNGVITCGFLVTGVLELTGGFATMVAASVSMDYYIGMGVVCTGLLTASAGFFVRILGGSEKCGYDPEIG